VSILGILNDSFLEELSDIIENNVVRVVTARILSDMLVWVDKAFLGSLCHYHHAVALLLNTLEDRFVETFAPTELKAQFWHEANVYITIAQSSIPSNETRIPSHQLDKADAILCICSFNIGSLNHSSGDLT